MLKDLYIKGAELRRAIILFVEFISSGEYELPPTIMMEMSNLYPQWEELIGKPQKAKKGFSLWYQ